MPFPSAWIFGSDTKESAANLKVVPYKNGEGGFVSTGTAYVPEQISVGNSISAVAEFVSNTSRYTSLPTTTYQYQSGNTSGSVGQAAILLQEFSNVGAYVLYTSAAIAILVVIALALRRR